MGDNDVFNADYVDQLLLLEATAKMSEAVRVVNAVRKRSAVDPAALEEASKLCADAEALMSNVLRNSVGIAA